MMRTKVSFYQEFSVTDMVGQSQTLVQFRGNNPYDPEYALGGNTAMNWTIYNKWYRKYMVTYSTISFQLERRTFNFDISDEEQWLFVAILPRSVDNTDAPDNYFEWMETPNARINMKYYGAQDRSSRRIKLRHRMSTSKLYGRPMDPSMDLSAVAGGPSIEWLWNLYIFNRGLVEGPTTSLIGRVWITYYVTFSEKSTHPATYASL